MFRVINFIVVMRLVAVATTVLTVTLYALITKFFPQVLTKVGPLTLAPTIALILTFLLTSKWISRKVWKIFRFFNGDLYPDLNGTWEGEIELGEDGEKLEARAVIRQYILNTEIDMHTKTAKSSTLEATPVISSGQFKLYYTFSARPRNPNYGAYTGSNIFDIRRVGDGSNTQLELSGYYYTDRQTCGRTRLRQVSLDANRDVSYY